MELPVYPLFESVSGPCYRLVTGLASGEPWVARMCIGPK